MRSCFLPSFVEFRSVVSQEKSKMSQPIRGQCGHLWGFFYQPEKHKLGRGVEILFPAKLRWIPLSGFRGEVVNVSANQKPVGYVVFRSSVKHKHSRRRRWDFVSCPVSLNSVRCFQRRIENVSANKRPGRSTCFFFRSSRKTQTW